LLDEAFYRELEDWSRIAEPENWFSEEARTNIEQLEQTLVYLMKKCAFLVEYKMVQVNGIDVRKRKYTQARFNHRLRLLNSTDAQFKSHEEIADQFSDSESVLLLRSVKDTGDYLNLSLFIVDTQDVEVTVLRSAGLRSDIYLFQGIDEGRAIYIGANTQNQVDLSQWDQWFELKAEFDRMKKGAK